jgi:hypothetical protein
LRELTRHLPHYGGIERGILSRGGGCRRGGEGAAEEAVRRK